MAETLAAGDLTTAFAIWLRTVQGDQNQQIRDRLVTNYSVPQGSDLTTLLARFLATRV